jgi:hypothetical protein
MPICRLDNEKLKNVETARQAGEPVFCIGDAGQIFFQGMESVSQGALTDPALFHALSLVLSLAANKDIPNLETLTNRGETLKNLAERMGNMQMVPQVSTLTAMLLLIGYEVRTNQQFRLALRLTWKLVSCRWWVV